MNEDNSIKILLVEDNEGDSLLMQELFKESAIASELRIVTDGEMALDFLHHRSPYESEFVPDLVLLDINLPKLSGMEVLTEVRKNSALSTIPIVMVSSSRAEGDIGQAKELGANGYFVKGSDYVLRDFVRMVDHIKENNYIWVHLNDDQ